MVDPGLRGGTPAANRRVADRRTRGRAGLFDAAGLWIFLAAWVAYGAFHQGGGWHQNARFAAVRAIVEQGRLTVDDYVLYVAESGEQPVPPRLLRLPVERGGFEIAGRRFALGWTGSGEPLAANPCGAPVARIDRVLATGDLAYAQDHLHPNKAPGATWLAVPAYALAHRLGRVSEPDGDEWWTLTRDAWLSTLGSVGLLSALGVALFFREARRLAAGAAGPALLATCAFAFGTPYFPYATMLFDGNVAAVALLAAWAAASGVSPLAWTLAGCAAGAASVTTYSAALAVPLLAIATLRRGGPRGVAAFGVGLAPPLALAAWHHAASLGTPLAIPYQFQDPLFRDTTAWLGVFDAPSFERLVGITISPFRGLFFCAPVLALGVAGSYLMLRDRARRADAGLLVALVVVFALFNVCFNGWHGGWSVGPRYLVPALAFLALPLVFAAQRARRLTLALSAVSIASMTLFTAVDPQPSVGTSPIASRPDRSGLWRSPLFEYALPIFTTGLATPILEAQRRERSGASAEAEVPPPLAHFVGPVSANPIGVYEAWIGQGLPASGDVPRWNAFNVGEFLWPGSRLSLLLPGSVVAALLVLAGRAGRRTSPPTELPS